MSNVYYKGTDIKVQVTVKASGFDQSSDAYTVDLYCGNNKVRTYSSTKAGDIVADGNGGFFIPLSTSGLQSGVLTMVVTAYVPDMDFPNTHVRKEIAAPIKLGIINDII